MNVCTNGFELGDSSLHKTDVCTQDDPAVRCGNAEFMNILQRRPPPYLLRKP